MKKTLYIKWVKDKSDGEAGIEIPIYSIVNMKLHDRPNLKVPTPKSGSENPDYSTLTDELFELEVKDNISNVQEQELVIITESEYLCSRECIERHMSPMDSATVSFKRMPEKRYIKLTFHKISNDLTKTKWVLITPVIIVPREQFSNLEGSRDKCDIKEVPVIKPNSIKPLPAQPDREKSCNNCKHFHRLPFCHPCITCSNDHDLYGLWEKKESNSKDEETLEDAINRHTDESWKKVEHKLFFGEDPQPVAETEQKSPAVYKTNINSYIEWESFLRSLDIVGREKELILRKMFDIKRQTPQNDE